MPLSALSDLFEYLCYGSTTIRNIFRAYSQADWCNNCGFIHRSMKFSACLDNVPRQIYSYGANRNNDYVSLGSHFTKEHCGRIVFSIMRQNQLLLNDSTYPNSRQCAWNNL